MVQICDKTAIKAQTNDERSLNRGSYSLLTYSTYGNAVLLKYCSNDGSQMLMFNNDSQEPMPNCIHIHVHSKEKEDY